MQEVYWVELVRGSKKSLTWEHPNLRSAMIRVIALVELHSCDYVCNNHRIVVDATAHYTPRLHRSTK